MENKRILTFQDISCVGQCSMTVALPIISACGIECCVLPSAVLSTHTGGFCGYTFRDLSSDIPSILSHWEKEGIFFDAFYSGYLGSKEQINDAVKIIDTRLVPDGVSIVDPAMADNGKLYPGFDSEYAKEMGSLMARADITLPNITEASLVGGVEYIPENHTESYIDRLIGSLIGIGCKNIVLTGVTFDKDRLGVAVYNEKTGKTEYYMHERINVQSHGTGDVYASSFVGAYMHGASVFESAKLAADFTLKSIIETTDRSTHFYGVRFERAIPYLVRRISEL